MAASVSGGRSTKSGLPAAKELKAYLWAQSLTPGKFTEAHLNGCVDRIVTQAHLLFLIRSTAVSPSDSTHARMGPSPWG